MLAFGGACLMFVGLNVAYMLGYEAKERDLEKARKAVNELYAYPSDTMGGRPSGKENQGE